MTAVVVGGGAAGMLAALGLAERTDVVLVTKGVLGEGSTAWAQGGIAAATGDDDDPGRHAADTVDAGAGLTDPAAALALAEDGPARIAELIALGMPFDGDAAGPHRGLEAAHSVARILHAGGDATGAHLAATLAAAVRRSGVTVRERTAVTDLVVRDGAVTGVLLGDDALPADRTVLATGGAGMLFAHTTNPPGATADGVALAARAGAVLSDLEFFQFHPTALAVAGTPLVSEAVRGAGAVLLDARGSRFMPDVHPAAELAPRDVVARAIARVMAGQEGRPALLDARAVPGLAARFPGIDRTVRAAGLDWTREPIPVVPAAHYWMGGIATDADGRTSLPGLFAAGEVARTGVHGANRLASNSLLEALVLAHRVAVASPGGPARFGEVSAAGAAACPAEDAPPFSRAALQRLLWAHAGLVRDGAGLARAAAVLAAWTAGPAPADPEDANLLTAAVLLVDAASARTESRGAHARADHPATDPAQQRSGFRRLLPAPVPVGGAAWR